MSANRTRETTTTTGTGGSITLNGAVAGHASFNEYYAGNAAANVEYTIEEGDDYEVGIGSFAPPNIFNKATIYEKKEGGVYTKSPGTGLSLSGGAQIFVGITKEEIDDKASLTNDNLFTGENTAAGFIKSAVSKIVASSANVVDVKVYDTRLDTDNGAWRKKVQWTSWYNEPLNTATRGATRAFPEVALIVAETDTVTIYDATDPGVPMWRVTNRSGPGGLSFWRNVAGIDCVGGIVAKNGRIGFCINNGGATGNNGFAIIDFSRDSLLRWSAASSGGAGNLTVSDDSSATAMFSFILPDMVSFNVNNSKEVALSGAETDPNNYGLPYQSTIVGTAAGGSLINYDGGAANKNTVVNFTGAVNIVSVDIDENGFCILAASDKVYIYETAPTSDVALASADYTFDTAGTSGPHISGVITSVNLEGSDGAGNASFTVGSDEGVFRVDYVSGGVGSVVSQIRNDWQSGSKAGDVRGAWLADGTAETISDTELVTNGTFDTSTTGWTAGNSGVLSVVSQTLKVENGAAAFGYASQAITGVTAGKTYVLTADITLSGTDAYLRLGADFSTTNGVTVSSDGNYSVFFTATNSSIAVKLQNATSASGAFANFDNVSVTEVVADRSAKGNNLTINGTLTKSAVATGSELMGYSGFSAANYLSQAYDADFDFGTGDFCVMGWFKTAVSQSTASIVSRTSGPVSGFHVYKDTTSLNGSPVFRVGSVVLKSSTVTKDSEWHHFVAVRESGIAKIYVDGNLSGTIAAPANVDVVDTLSIGYSSSDPVVTFPSGLSLIRISAYAPTAAQIAKIYNDERKLFQPNALAFLQGTSNSVQGLSYDEDTDKLDVATADGTTTITGLLPIDYIDSVDVGTSDNHKAVSRIDDQLAIGTAAETVFTKPDERL